MNSFGKLLSTHIEQQEITPYQVALNNVVDYGLLNKVINGKRRASDELIEKLSLIPELKISKTTLMAWRAMDDYSEEAILQAAIDKYGVKGLIKKLEALNEGR